MRNRWAACAGRTVAVITLVAAMVAGCAGAPDPPREPGTTVIVVGNRSNMPRPVLTDAARGRLEEAVRSGDRLFLITVSGEPGQAGELDLGVTCRRPSVCRRKWAEQITTVEDALVTAKPKAAEADLLSAVSLAADTLASRAGAKTLLIIDNGLQTTGQLDLTAPDALAIDPDSLARDLVDNDGLTRLDGVNVLMTGLNATAGDQPRITPPRQDRLRQLWTAVFEYAGAVKPVVVQAGQFPENPPIDGLPPVSVVPKDDPKVKRPPEPEANPPCIRLREDQIGFLPDSPEFRDRAKARGALKDIAAQLRRTKFPTTLIGTTAIPENNTGKGRLSYRRAVAVKEQLVALKVDGGQLTPVGVGTDFKGYKSPRAGGRWNPVVAAKMRLVFIQPKGTTCKVGD